MSNQREEDNFELEETRDQADEAHDQDLQTALAESEEMFAELKLEKEEEEEVKKLSAEEYAQKQRENDQRFRDALAKTGREVREKREEEEERELQQAMRKSKEDYAKAQQESDQDLEDVKRFTGEQADREAQDIFEQQTRTAMGISMEEAMRLDGEQMARWRQRPRGYNDNVPASGNDVDSSEDTPLQLNHNVAVRGNMTNNFSSTPSSSAQREGLSQPRPNPHPTPSNRASERPAGAPEDPNEVEKIPAAEKAREAFNRRFDPG